MVLAEIKRTAFLKGLSHRARYFVWSSYKKIGESIQVEDYAMAIWIGDNDTISSLRIGLARPRGMFHVGT